MWWFCRFRTALVFLTAVIVCKVILTDAANETASDTDTSSSVPGLQSSHVMLESSSPGTSTPAMEMESDMMSTPTTESYVMSTPPMETGPPSHTPLILYSSTQTMAVSSESISSSHTVIMPSSEMPESSLGDTSSVSYTSPMMETTQGLPTATPVLPQATEVPAVQPSPASSDMVSSTLLPGVEVTSVAPGCSAKPCKNGATCNESGSEFNCTCAAGWTGNTCETDIDECKADHNCSENADCENVDASYNCTCKPGYEGDGWQCKDIDECSDTELNDCFTRADCQNTNGSFECTCKPGFTGDGKTQCQDIDECSNATLNKCLKNEWALCDNTDGSYNCSCKQGFQGNGKTECDDIDECASAASNDCLDEVATCANTNGSYLCSCKPGFSGDGRTECIDIDDCVDKPCQNGGVCYNTEAGHFDCICPPGWTNHTCNTDIDECSLENSTCHENSECENKPLGSFTCTCMAGYRGNGTHCTEIMLFEDKADAMVKQGLGSMETSYGPFSLDGGQPDVYVHMNGYISVGDRLTSPYPPGLDERDNFTAQVFAPFWTSIDSREGPGKLVISVLRDSEDSPALNVIKEALDGGDKIEKLRSGVIATWHMVSPPPASSYKDKEMATFQAVVVSDWTSSWVLLNYDLGTLSWDADSDKRSILVGHAQKNQSFIVLAAEPKGDENETSAYEIDKRTGNTEKVGRWQFNVSGSQPEVGQCLIWFSDIDRSLVKTKLDSLTACPCTRDQAQVDLNYIYDETENLATHVFDKRVQCVYDSELAFLVRGSPSGGYPILPETDDFNQTKGRELCCKDGVNLCSLFYELYPSDDCSSYHPPAQAFSWGDPHIITTRGVEYTFNGLGEFLLWKAGDFEIQSRTTHDTDSTGNTTQFTAFVMKTTDSDHIDLRYNAAGEIDVAVNGENLDPTPATSVLNGVVLRSRSDAVIVSFPNAVNFKISVGVGGLQLSSMLPADLVRLENSGLMAMTDDGMFQFENKTKIPADASEAELFLYGMSWQVSNTSSLFNYTLDGGQDYEDFNPAGGFTPVFYSDMTVEEMFPDNATRDRATELCHSYKACLGDLAATSNKDLANQTYQHMKHLKNIADKLANMPPVWDRMPSELNLTVGETLEIWHHAYDNNTGDNVTIIYPDELWSSDTFTVETDNKTYLKLTPLKGAQDAPMSLKLVASDGKGGASEYWPAIFLCACHNPSECQDVSHDDMRSKDRFYVRPCDCLPGYEGDYCETEYDVCQRDQPCYPGVNCTVVSAGNFSCSPCPSGLNGDGASCYDVNECLEANDCEHPETCNNLPGNYTCGCRWGFTQDDNGKNCTDIDECQEVMGRCGNGAYCTNMEGGFACDCIPGYFNQSGICVKDLSLRQYSIELRITATKSGGPVTFDKDYNDKSSAMFQELKDIVVNSLTPALETVNGFTSVDIMAFRNGSVIADTVVTFDEPVDPNEINQVWGSCASSCSLGDLLVAEAPTVAVRDFCKDDSQNDCDKMSTMCKNNNGTFRCDCNPGFRPSPYYSSRCDDIDECKSSPSPCGEATCENTAGSFSCVCQDGLLFLSGEKKCVDKCHSNPCKNLGVCVIIGEATACKCGEDWTGPTCEEEAQPWKQSLIIVAAVLGSVCLIAFIIIIVLCCRRRSKSKAFGELSDSSGEVEAKAYQGWSGKIPRPKRNTADNLEMVENGNRGMADDPSKPLTGFGGKGLEGHDNPTYTEGGDQNGQQARGGKASNEYF